MTDRPVLRTVLIACAALVASAGLAFGAIFLAMRAGQGSSHTGVPIPAASTPGSVAAPGASGATSSTPASVPPTGAGAAQGTLPGGVTSPTAAQPGAKTPAQPAPSVLRIALVKAHKLVVAGEDGRSVTVVASLKPGSIYHLSPDRRSIAYAVPVTGELRMALYAGAVGAQAKHVADIQRGTDFCWAPDGTKVAAGLVTVHAGKVTEMGLGTVGVGAAGKTTRFVFDGYDPTFSPDGSQLAFLKHFAGSSGPPGELWRAGSDGTSPIALTPGKGVLDAGWLDATSVVAVEQGARPQPDQLVRLSSDGSTTKVLATTGNDVLRSLHDVLTGGQAGRFAYDMVGDDGYSRIFVIGSDGQQLTPVPSGRDAYPLGWSADGARLFYVEGNVSQGEPTALFSVDPQGGGKRVVLNGVGL